MRRIEHTLIIEAPPKVVFSVIMDLAAYPQWNRFTPRISLHRPTPAVGVELDLDCWISETKLLRDEREVILALDPERYAFCMGTSRRRGRPGIRSERWQLCHPHGDDCTHFVNHESFRGPLAPVVYLLYAAKLRRAFARYGQDLKKRAESLAAGRPHR